MICAGPRASRAMPMMAGGRRQIHHSLMTLNLDDKDVSSSSSSDMDSSATVASSQTGQGYAPVQTLNKSPIVQKLWKTRDEAKRRIMGDMTLGESECGDLSLATSDVISGRNSCSYEPPSKIGKHPSESEVGIEYLFSTDEFLKETYKNPWGEMRFGKILEDLDALAGNIAFEHVEGNPLIVTAGVDRIRLRQRPNIGADQQLSGRVTWVGSSSMEIRMRIAAVGSDAEWLEAYFTFVTLHPETKQAIRISPLLPETDEERGAFELGALKAQAKKAARKNKIQIGRPLSEESLKIDTRAARLLEEAGTLLRMPSLADQDTMLISQTAQSNAMVAQPQARNLHDRIFGGKHGSHCTEVATVAVLKLFLRLNDDMASLASAIKQGSKGTIILSDHEPERSTSTGLVVHPLFGSVVGTNDGVIPSGEVAEGIAGYAAENANNCDVLDMFKGLFSQETVQWMKEMCEEEIAPAAPAWYLPQLPETTRLTESYLKAPWEDVFPWTGDPTIVMMMKTADEDLPAGEVRTSEDQEEENEYHRFLQEMPELAERENRAEATEHILRAFNLAHPDVKQDMEPFVIKSGRSAKSIVAAEVAKVEKTPLRAYSALPGGKQKQKRAQEIDYENKKKMVSSETCNMIVVVNGLIDLWQRGLVDLWETPCKWNKEKRFFRIMTRIPTLLKFDYCQGQAKYRKGDASLGKNRDPVKTDGKYFIDILHGNFAICKNTEQDLDRGSLKVKEDAHYHESSKAVFQPIKVSNYAQKKNQDSKSAYLSVDECSKFEVVKNWKGYKVPGTSCCMEMSLTHYNENARGCRDGDPKRVGKKLKAHQVVMSTARTLFLSASVPAHHMKGGFLDGVLDKGEDFWEEYECTPITPGERTLINGRISTKLFGEGLGFEDEENYDDRVEKIRADNPEKLQDKDASRLCDGDHLWGRSEWTNGVTRVQTCSHRENICRSRVRGRARDWLLPGMIGKGKYVNGDKVPEQTT